MAGDWIKMRTNLWSDPRVSRLCDLTDSGEAAIVGGLYWLWASADEHSADGFMPGLSPSAIDRKTGIRGFGNALASIGWIEVADDGIFVVRFDEHNGSSAKRRAMEARRKAGARNMSACDADTSQQDVGHDAELEREKEKEVNHHSEERAEVNQPPTPEPPEAARPTAAGIVCRKLRQAGVASVNPSNPKLLALLAAGMGEEELADLAQEPASKGKGFAWLLAAAEGRRRDAAAVGILPQARASPHMARNGRQAAISNYAAQAAAARGDSIEQHRRTPAERDITGECLRVA